MICLITQYFSVNKIFLQIIGLWPYQQTKLVQFQFIFLAGVLAAAIIVQVVYFDSIICIVIVIHIKFFVSLIYLFTNIFLLYYTFYYIIHYYNNVDALL